MSDPISFDSSSPRFGLPMLYSGQAQKEFYVNECHSLLDALMHCAVEGIADSPPASPMDGTSWLIGGSPTGAWSGQAGKIVSRQAGNWLFTAPRDGMRVLNRSNGQDIGYLGGWRNPSLPTAIAGGTTIDVEARVAILQLLDALSTAGIFPAP